MALMVAYESEVLHVIVSTPPEVVVEEASRSTEEVRKFAPQVPALLAELMDDVVTLFTVKVAVVASHAKALE